MICAMHRALCSHLRPRKSVLVIAFLTLVVVYFTRSGGLALAGAGPKPARMVILMVWDGLRPDSVSPSATPNLYALKKRGAYFSDHHSIYPTLTMVNAAALATGYPPGANGILANKMYLAPLLGATAASAGSPLRIAQTQPASLEDARLLDALSGPGALDGKLVEVETVAQQLMRSGGFAGIVGKTGPTFLFDDRVDAKEINSTRETFISDSQTLPPSLTGMLTSGMDRAALAAAVRANPPFGDQDQRLTDAFISGALPKGAESARKNRPAFLVLWQHNPDITEHIDGLGTAAFYRALGICDANLGRVLAAVAKMGLQDRTDVIVASDHGFATIKMRVDLSELLIAQGLKQPKSSEDVVVSNNFGTDEIYLSPHFSPGQRAALMRQIVEYAAAQQWCGPIFSRAITPLATRGYAGEIPGTFDQSWFGLLDPARSADLVISFRELDGDNSKLTGPQFPAQVLGATGVGTEPNRSQALTHPINGIAYADSGLHSTAGDGTHGAMGAYEIHNFAAADGPDFRRAYVDEAPSSNIDLARTIAMLLLGAGQGAPQGQSPGAARVLTEALANGASAPAYHHLPLEVTLDLAGQRVVTTIEVEQMQTERYPTGATVIRVAAAKVATSEQAR
jgi:arylsulfatase A-like enzyme